MSSSMSLSGSLSDRITPAFLDRVLDHLAPLFLSSTVGDLPAARYAASQMLAAYDAETEEELRFAAAVASFSLHALEALGQAMAPDLPLTKILRLRGSAVSLNREAHKNQRKLEQLQRERRVPDAATTAIPAPPPVRPAVSSDPVKIDKALDLIEFAHEALEASSKNGLQDWTLSRQQRRAAKRIAATFKRKQAEHIRREASYGMPPPAAALVGPAISEMATPNVPQSAAE